MTLHDWYLKTDSKSRQAAAKAAKTSEAYLWQLATGYRTASVSKARLVAKATGLSEAVILGLE